MKATITLQPNGRIVIPSAIRQEADISPGQKLEIIVQDGRIIITPQVTRLRQAQALLSEHSGDDDKIWSDELIAERRKEDNNE